jgi:methyl-accepting chemotaxis protein
MKISLKLTLFLAGVAVLFVGLEDALFGETRSMAAGYDELMNTPIRQADLARVAQVDFKKQVQEWKDILLRGHDAEDLATYTRLFRDAETRVHENAFALSQQIRDATARQLMADFVVAHEALGKKYQEAYDVFVAGGFDFKGLSRNWRPSGVDVRQGPRSRVPPAVFAVIDYPAA